MVEECLLKSINFVDLEKWYVEYYLREIHLKSKFELIKLRKIISPKKNLIKKDDYKGDIPIVDKIVFKTGDIVFRKEKKTGMNLYSLDNEDLLVSNINFHQGATALNTFGKIVASTHYQPYSINTEIIDPIYLVKILRSEPFLKMVSGKKAQGIKNESGYDFIGNFKIPVPSIPEQKTIIQKYQDSISNAEAIEKEAEKLIIFKENYIQNILGIPLIDDTIQSTLLSYSKFSDLLEKWTISPLQSEINEKLRLSKYRLDKISSLNCVTRSWKKKEYKEKKFDYIEIGGINPETEEISSVQLEVSKAPSRATQLVYKGDLIFGMTRPYLKKFAIVDTAHDGFICSSGFQVIQPSENYNLHFILELLKSNVCISQFKEAMTGALYPALNAEQLGNIRIPLPPLPVQNEIVEHINQIKAQVKDLRQQAKELREKAKIDFERSVFE